MKHLFFDTSTERGIVGVAENEKLLHSVLLPQGLQGSKYLIPALKDLLMGLKLSYKDLDFISSGIGPGSYTGIRVSAALAQSLAFALKKPLIGFSSLSLFKPFSAGSFAVILDAKYAGFYLQKGIFFENNLELKPPEVVSVDEIIKVLENIKTLITPDLNKLQIDFKKLLPSLLIEESPPLGEVAAQKIYTQFLAGNISQNFCLDLLYLRKTQVEIEREKKV